MNLALAILISALVEAAPLESCREAFDALLYRDAAQACAEALRGARAEDLPALYRLLGLSLAAADDVDAARDAFASLLALDAAAQLPDTISPKLRAPFDEARGLSAGQAIQVTIALEETPRVGTPARASIAIQDGRARPVTKVELKTGLEARLLDRSTLVAPILIEIPPGSQSLTIAVTALDRFGGRLSFSERSFPVEPPRARPSLLSWPLWAGAAALFGSVGVIAGVYADARSSSARDRLYADEAALDADRASDAARVANLSYVAAGVFALGATVLWLSRESEGP